MAKAKKKVKLKVRKTKKIHPVKSRGAGISPKPKLFNRVKTAKRRKVLDRKSKIKNQKSKFKLKTKKNKAKLKKSKLSNKIKRPKTKRNKKKPVLKKKKPSAKKKVLKRKKAVGKKFRPVKAKTIRRVVKKTFKKPGVKKTPKPKKTEVKKQPDFTAEALFKARIKVIGIGGGGVSIVSEIGRSLEKATFVVADTDIRALKKKAGIKYFWFGGDLTRGLGTGVNIELAKQAAESAREKISDIFKDQDIIIFIASLGGGLGSGATQVFAQEAKKYGAITFGIFTLPFKFEGKNKARIAQNALKALRQSLNVSLTIPNEKIFKIIDESTPITNAFSVVNKSLINSLESLIDLIYNPGIINIDFADLRTILKGRGNLAFLNTIEESGKNRADKICEKTFVNPLLQSNSFTAEKILFNIMGSENLSMFEVEKVSSHIARLNPNAKIIFGISKNLKLKNKIKTTILMAGGGVKPETEAKKAESVEESAKQKLLVDEKEPESKEKKKNIKPPRPKKQRMRKPPQKSESGKSETKEEKEQKPASGFPAGIPVFEAPSAVASGFEPKNMNITETVSLSGKKAMRRSGLEIKKAEEQEEKKRIAQEKEWETPAFLRRIKFKS